MNTNQQAQQHNANQNGGENRTRGHARRISTSLTAVTVLTAVASLVAPARPALACDTCESKYKPGTYTGEALRIGNGVAYSWVTLNEKGKPAALGVTITESALEGLPATPPKGTFGYDYVLSLPEQAGKTAFKHVGFGWNPQGHEPPGIYDRAHFDVHFYMITPEAREKITAKGADVERCRKPLPAGFAPAGYVYAKGTEVPMMGGHFIDPKSPEFNGKEFTTTFLYGAYDGNLIFFEPMLTKAFLETKPQMREVISVPTSYANGAFYPTAYSVRYDPARREYNIAIEGMTWRESAGKTPVRAAKTKPAAVTARRQVARRK
jgi:hypothetical protein